MIKKAPPVLTEFSLNCDGRPMAFFHFFIFFLYLSRAREKLVKTSEDQATSRQLTPGLDNTRLSMSLTAGAGTRSMSLLSSFSILMSQHLTAVSDSCYFSFLMEFWALSFAKYQLYQNSIKRKEKRKVNQNSRNRKPALLILSLCWFSLEFCSSPF